MSHFITLFAGAPRRAGLLRVRTGIRRAIWARVAYILIILSLLTQSSAQASGLSEAPAVQASAPALKSIGNSPEGAAPQFNTVIPGLSAADWGTIQEQMTQTDPHVFGLVARPFPVDGTDVYAFGYAASLSGDTLVVGDPAYGDVAHSYGAAFVFYRDQGGTDAWGEVAKLTPPDGMTGDEFGLDVAADGDTIVVGAWLADDGSMQDQGAAYVFSRNQGGADAWGFVSKLTAFDRDTYDMFGRQVSVSGDTIVVGMSEFSNHGEPYKGAAYVFNRDPVSGAWVPGPTPKLTAFDGADGDEFGEFVSVSGDTIFVGAPKAVIDGIQQGAAYVFNRDPVSSLWTPGPKLVVSGSIYFGMAVSVSGDTAVVSGQTVVGATKVGAAYVFNRDRVSDSWQQVAQRLGSDPTGNESFGNSVSLSGNTIVVGAPYATIDGRQYNGAAYIFSRNKGGSDAWGQVGPPLVGEVALGRFGNGVSVSGNTVAIGAEGGGSLHQEGEAFVYEAACVDSDGDGLTDCVELEVTKRLPNGTTITLDPNNPDTDGDGLLDSWEVDPAKVPGGGFDLNSDGKPDDLNSDGVVDRMDWLSVFCPCFNDAVGAADNTGRPPNTGDPGLVKLPDPFHKDVYVEIDWQDCRLGNCFEATVPVVTPPYPTYPATVRLDDNHHAPSVQGLKLVVWRFALAPVQNPDELLGINLNILIDEPLRHEPNCDWSPSRLRSDRFGTTYQRRYPAILDAREDIFRYAWSGHSSYLDDTVAPILCKTPGLIDLISLLMKRSEGLPTVPDFDYTPFGEAAIGGRDILITMGPLWICPRAVDPCFFVVATFPDGTRIPIPFVSGTFPAYVTTPMGQKTFSKPMNEFLDIPGSLDISGKEGVIQLWSRTFMHLLGHSLGLADDATVLNDPTEKGLHTPDSYMSWDNLQYAPGNGTLVPETEKSPIPDPDPTPTPLASFQADGIPDPDGDGIPESEDNCPGIANPDQADLDGDHFGDACDPDIDEDGIANETDSFPLDTDNDGVANSVDSDDDGDGIADTADNCALVSNANQADADQDGVGDMCDPDDDNDNFLDFHEQVVDSDPFSSSSQPEIPGDNLCGDGLDNDQDGKVDGFDEGCVDTDSDSVPNYKDNCPDVANPGFRDLDGDGQGDDCDPDDDNDNASDEVDFCPDTVAGALADANGCSDAEVDADGDGILNPFALSSGPSSATGFDNCPIVSNPDQEDSDGDGIGDVCVQGVPANLIIIKHMVNDNGGTATAADFTMSVVGTNVNPPLFPGEESPGTTVLLDAGSYSVSESGPSGYTMTLSADCFGTIAVGETRTCTITNDDIPPTLIVIKHVINNNGGTATAANFTMTVTGTNVSPASFPGDETGTTVTLNAGDYSVDETSPTGYAMSLSVDCSGTITIGETKTCTVTNDDIPPTLIVIKHVVNNNGGMATAANFTMTLTGTNVSPASFPGDENGTTVQLDAGDYSVSETGPSGYTASFSTDCAGTAAVGDAKICTITNESTQTVDIDIIPHSKQNRIHIHRKHGPIHSIQVAILSTSDFDAPSLVDRTSLTFGHTGDEESLFFCFNRARDVNRDGLKDLVCVFRGRLTGFQIGDKKGVLNGTTIDGARIEGSDSVKIVITSEHDEEEHK